MYNISLIEKYLIELLNIPSPTGYTKEIVNYIKNQLDKMNIYYEVSNKGILVAKIEGIDKEDEITLYNKIYKDK